MRFWNILELFLVGSLTTASALPGDDSKGTFKALYDFASQATGETSLQKGELVTVLQQDASGWWLVQRLDGSSEGWTPGSYLSKIDSNSSSWTKKATLSASTIAKPEASKASSSSAKISKTTSPKAIKHASSSSSSKQSLSTGKPSMSTRHGSTVSSISISKSVSPSTNKSVSPVLFTSSSQSSLNATSSYTLPASGVAISTRISTKATSFSTSRKSSLSDTSSTDSPIPTPKTTLKSISTFNTRVSTPSNLLSSLNSSDADLHSITLSAPKSTGHSQLPTSASNQQAQVNSTLSLLASATGQASSRNSSIAAVPTECADPGGVNGVTTACWNALDMTSYINQWAILHNGACSAQTSFAQCFLKLLDIGMNDCVSISSGTCPPPSWLQFKDHNMSVRDFYVAYNIYAVWTFFNSYYSAIGNARSAATDSVAAIVSLLDPPKTNDAELSNINFALAIGLTFVKIEGFVNPTLEAFVGFATNAAKQIPQVARYLFPGPPGDTKFTQLGQISNQMGTLTDNLQKNVAIALSVIQNDTSTFLSFTGTGAFSNNPVVKIDQESNSLLTALNTYVISLCLQANKWQISRAIDTDVNQLMANGTQLTWNVTDCGKGYDSNSICGGYYWNKTIDVSYTLTNTDDMFANPQPIMPQFFANWTTPQLLFDGALECQMAKGTGNPNITPVAGASDVTSTPCLSSVKICTWDLNPSHFGTQYEYTDCDVQDHFATQGCTQCDATTDFCTNVPSTYLGGYLLNSLGEGPQYVYCNDGHGLIDAN